MPPPAKEPRGPLAERIVIEKARRRLTLQLAGAASRIYAVAIGRNAAADKEVEGDHATPLGEFYVCAKNPRSRYHLSLCISYPNIEDAERGLRAGLIRADEHAAIAAAIDARRLPPQKTRLGGEIYIHGGGAARDWTQGCVAMEDAAIEEVYAAAQLGTPVTIRP